MAATAADTSGRLHLDRVSTSRAEGVSQMRLETALDLHKRRAAFLILSNSVNLENGFSQSKAL